MEPPSILVNSPPTHRPLQTKRAPSRTPPLGWVQLGHCQLAPTPTVAAGRREPAYACRSDPQARLHRQLRHESGSEARLASEQRSQSLQPGCISTSVRMKFGASESKFKFFFNYDQRGQSNLDHHGQKSHSKCRLMHTHK